jgi:hypothetical protein
VICHAFQIAGVRIDLRFRAAPPAELRRYAPFACGQGPDAAVLELWPRELHGLDGFTGHVIARDGEWRVKGAEHLGHLALDSGRGEAIADRTLVIVDTFVRALVARRAAEQGGVLLHAAAVRVDGRAHLVPGRSGAGKSTFAALAGHALTDELAVLTSDGAGGYVVHGTPWWEAKGGSGPLDGVYALAWNGEAVEPLPRAGLLRHLATSLVLPVDGPEERARAFAACGAMARMLPFRRLTFTPSTQVDVLLRGAAARCAA